MFGPNYAMNGFARRIANSAAGESFLCRFWSAFVALAQSFLDKFDLALVSGSSGFDQRHISRETHAINMISGCSVVKSVQDHSEILEERETEFGSVKKQKIENAQSFLSSFFFFIAFGQAAEGTVENLAIGCSMNAISSYAIFCDIGMWKEK